MSVIKVTSEELQATSVSLHSGAEQVQRELDVLRGKVEALISANWNGTASASFNELWKKWHDGANQVNEALEGISGLLAAAARTYQETEDALASQMRG
jgi:WXG100 family type VII secretion target